MGEILPNGQLQSYYCLYCGQPCNIQGSGHGKGVCVPPPPTEQPKGE